jgi:hypothetical protein
MTDERGLAGFWELHARARAGLLTPVEQREHRFLLQAFLRAMAQAQNAGVVARHAPRATSRATPRIHRAVQADLALPGGELRTATFDLGLGGFSALVPVPPPAGTSIDFTLRLAHGRHATGAARVVAARARGRDARVSFAFDGLRSGVQVFEAYVVESLAADLLPGSALLDEVALRFGEPLDSVPRLVAL